MAALEWDWFQREELIGHISDIRVQNLQVERVSTQKRTFTRWINFHLDRCNPPLKVKDLFQDMQDGKILMALLEMLSGQRLMHQYKHSTHRIFRLNNIAKALQFLEEGYVKLVSIDAPEIADGNPSMILGLIWNIILHFQIKEATGHLKIFSPTSSLCSLHSESDNDATLHCTPKETAPSAPYKDQRKVIKVLLNWVQRRTAKYGIAIQDFGTSWRSGIAFLALIKAIDPSLVDMREAMERPNRVNLEDAFKIAHINLDIPPLLEPEDVDVERPEEQSITTYVSQFLEHFPDIDENNAAEDAYESPFEDSRTKSVVMSTDLGVWDSNEMHVGDVHHALDNGSPSLHKEDDHSLVIQDGNSVEREMMSTPFINVSSINSSNTSLHQDGQSTSSDLHNGSLKPASDADATDTVEEIYVLLRPLKRKSSTGEKTFVLEKEPSSPVPYDHHSPVATSDVMKVESKVEIPLSFSKDLCDSSLETSSEKENTSLCNVFYENPNVLDQYLSLDHVGTQSRVSVPAWSRNVSESCTQTDEKPFPEQKELLPSVIDNALLDDEKVSVIPLNLVYYPHYEVPVSKVLEAFSITGNPQKELVPEFQHQKDLSPLADEAYQSYSELSNSLSLQELSPTFSEKTLCTPDSDQICTLDHLEAGEISQPFSSFQQTAQSQFMPVAMVSAPNELILVSLDKLPEQPISEVVNEQSEDRFSVQKYGERQILKIEHGKNQEKNSAGSEVLGDQLWDLLPSKMDPNESGEDVESYGNGSELSTDTIEKQHTVLQSTAISSSTILVNAENLQDKTRYDVLNNHKDRNQESLLKAMDGRYSSDSEQHTTNQDNVELLVQPKELIQHEHCPDPNIPSLTGQDEPRQKASENLLLLNEAKVTDETPLRTRLIPQRDNASVLEAMWHPAAVVIRDKEPSRSSGHPQLLYLVILLWMVVYWLIILLHLDLESLGQYISS
ncbi:uncharacterized protein clmna [Mustelus asterias]